MPFAKGRTCQETVYGYGFTNFIKQETKINEAISSLSEVREVVDMLATVKDKAILEGFRLTISLDEDSLKDESRFDSEAECNWISEGEDVCQE